MMGLSKDMTFCTYNVTLAERLALAVLAPIAKIVRSARGISADEAWELVRKTGNERGCDRHEMALACYLCYRDWILVQFFVDYADLAAPRHDDTVSVIM